MPVVVGEFMLKFFFNRFSFMVKLMEVLGVIVLPFVFYKTFFITKSLPAEIFFLIAIGIYGFIRFCATKRWYVDAPRYSGIELQFAKSLVPVGYIFTIFGILSLIFKPTFFLIIEAVLFAAIAHVNIILLYLRSKDHDPTPVNLFSKR